MPSERSDSDTSFVTIVIVIAGLAGAVWLGAATAAITSGHVPSGSLGDALTAAVRLPKHVGNPRLAWPEPARQSLPGPLLYWSCTAIAAAVVTGGGGFALRVGRRRVGSVQRKRLGVDADARFATGRELRPLQSGQSMKGRFLLGKTHGSLLATESGWRGGRRWRRTSDRGAVALIGPSRCGKSSAAIAGILAWDGPAVLSSVKADLLHHTIGWRSRLGECRVYDPTNTTDKATGSASPLRGADTITGAQRAARAVCAAAPRSNLEGGDYWFTEAEILLTSLFWVARSAGKTMTDVVCWVFSQDHPEDGQPGVVKPLLDRALLDPLKRSDAERASQFLRGVWGLAEETRSSVFGTAQTVVWPWADPGVAAASTGTATSLEWLLGDRNTLYLCAPIEDQKRLAPAFGGLLNDLVNQAYLRVAATGRPLDPPLLLVVDEAGNTPLAALPEYASTLAGIGVLLVTVWQSIAQLELAYGRGADVILTNHLTKVFFGGLSDLSSLDYASRLVGDEEVLALSESVHAGSRSTSRSTNRVPLVPAHLLRQMAPGDALLIHGTLPPAYVRTLPYHRDRRLRALAATPLDKPPLLVRSADVPERRGSEL